MYWFANVFYIFSFQALSIISMRGNMKGGSETMYVDHIHVHVYLIGGEGSDPGLFVKHRFLSIGSNIRRLIGCYKLSPTALGELLLILNVTMLSAGRR